MLTDRSAVTRDACQILIPIGVETIVFVAEGLQITSLEVRTEHLKHPAVFSPVIGLVLNDDLSRTLADPVAVSTSDPGPLAFIRLGYADRAVEQPYQVVGLAGRGQQPIWDHVGVGVEKEREVVASIKGPLQDHPRLVR